MTLMVKLLKFILNFIGLWLRLLRPGGVRAITAENIALRKQLITLARNTKRSPRLSTIDRILFGILTAMVSANRLSRIAMSIKPATLLKFHKALVQRKYHLLFSNKLPKKNQAQINQTKLLLMQSLK